MFPDETKTRLRCFVGGLISRNTELSVSIIVYSQCPELLSKSLLKHKMKQLPDLTVWSVVSLLLLTPHGNNLVPTVSEIKGGPAV